MSVVRVLKDLVSAFFVYFILAPLALLLCGAYIITGCRVGRLITAANVLAVVVLYYMIVSLRLDYEIEYKGDTWLKD